MKMNNINNSKKYNIRDFGGIHVGDKVIKSRMLLRGCALDNIDEEYMDILLNDYNLKTIIDLRTDKEVKERTDILIDDVENIHIPIFNEKKPGITHERGSSNTKKIDMPEMYREMLRDKCLEQIRLIIKTIIKLNEDEYSLLIHCTEGKDRTGIIAMIILLILGVDRNTIRKDYLYTNITNKKKATRYYYIYKYLRRDKEKAINVRDVYLAKEEYIDAAFKEIDDNYKSIDEFFSKGLKLKKSDLEKFRNKMLVEV